MNRQEQAALIRELWARLAKCENERDADRRAQAEQAHRAKQKKRKKP